MKERNIKKIEISSYLYKKTKQRPCTGMINGFDTETDKHGKTLTLSDAYRQPLILKTGNKNTPILDYLTNRKYAKGNNFFWNLDFDVRSIIHDFTYEEKLDIIDKGYTVKPHHDYYIKAEYFKNKLLTLSKYEFEDLSDDRRYGKYKNDVYKYWDIMPYYNNMSLKNAGVFVNRKKMQVDEIQILDYDSFHNDHKYQQMVLDRVKSDCIITKELSELMIEVLNNTSPYDKFFSLAGNSANQALNSLPDDKLNKDGYLKTASDKLNQLALMSYGGGIFTTLKKGYFDNVYSYDLNSAYTSAIINLKSFEGDQIFSPMSMTDYNEAYNHIFVKCNISIPEDIVYSPFQFRTLNQLYYLTGDFTNIWLSHEEYIYMMKKGYITKSIGFIGIDDTENESFFIFKEIQLKLYGQKQEIKARMVTDDYTTDKEKQYDKVLYNVVKTLLNSLYGKTINVNESKIFLDDDEIENIKDLVGIQWDIKQTGQMEYYNKRYNSGSLFSAPLGSEITAHTRVLINEAIEGHEDKIINIATDGIKSISPLNNIDIGDKLGQWENEFNNDSYSGLSLASGQYVLYNKQYIDNPESKKAKIKVGSRGMRRGFNFIPYLQDNKDKLGFEVLKTSPLRLNECVKGNNHNHNDINLFIEKTKTFSLNEEDTYTRKWDRDFINNGDILHNNISSKALSIKDLSKIKNIHFDKFSVGLE